MSNCSSTTKFHFLHCCVSYDVRVCTVKLPPRSSNQQPANPIIISQHTHWQHLSNHCSVPQKHRSITTLIHHDHHRHHQWIRHQCPPRRNQSPKRDTQTPTRKYKSSSYAPVSPYSEDDDVDSSDESCGLPSLPIISSSANGMPSPQRVGGQQQQQQVQRRKVVVSEHKKAELSGRFLEEPLLKENPSRFVLFPIEDNEVSFVVVLYWYHVYL